MATSAISAISGQQYARYHSQANGSESNSRIAARPKPKVPNFENVSDILIPRRLDSEGPKMCKSYDDPSENCCCSYYTIEAIVDEAYDRGTEHHPGIKAIEDYPCTPCVDLEILSDELAVVSHRHNLERKSQQSQVQAEQPERTSFWEHALQCTKDFISERLNLPSW